MNKTKKLAVLVMGGPSLETASLSLEEFYHRAEKALENLAVEVTYILSVNPGGAAQFCRRFAQTHPRVKVYTPPQVKGADTVTDTGAGRYIWGLYHASHREFDYVLEIDAEGAHNPNEAAPFVTGLLEGKLAILSTRFGKGGTNYYPLQRKASSFMVTILSNLCLGLGMYVSDMASGFESFKASLLRKVFEIHPPEEWIASKTTTALIQTELRACIFWLLRGMSLKELVAIVPITYGAEKKGTSLPTSVGIKALQGFFTLIRYRSEFIRKLKSQV